MAGLEFKLQHVASNTLGATEERDRLVGFRSFLRVFSACERMVSQLEKDLMNGKTQPREWLVSGTRIGSFTLELDPPNLIAGDEATGVDTATTLVNGIEYLDIRQELPAELREPALRNLQAVAGSLRYGNSEYEVEVTSIATGQTARISHGMAKKINQLLLKERISIGSIEGKLELISLHEGSRKFNIYQDVTGKAVRCDLPRDMEKQVIDALGNRVIVSGIIHRNLEGNPVRVRVERLRILRSGEGAPTLDELMGSIPDLTGDQTTEEFIRTMRDDSASE